MATHYNTVATATALIGQAVSEAHLAVARGIIDNYSEYRWSEKTVTRTFSGRGIEDDKYINVNSPITSVTSLTVDDTSYTEDTDFEVEKSIGRIYVDGGLPWGIDNIVLVYVYGWTTGDGRYDDSIEIVKWVEAAIALYIKKNPLMMTSPGISGASLGFDNDHISKLLAQIPKPLDFTAVT